MLRTTLRSLWEHKRRLLSTIIAVVLGVAFMAGTLVLGDTLDASFDELLGDATAGIDAEVRGPELFDTGFGKVRDPLPADLVATVASVDGVKAAAGYVQFQGGRLLDTDGDPIGPANGPPTIFESYTSEPSLASYEIVDGRGVEADDEMILNLAAAENGDLSVGDQVVVVSTEGRSEFTLVGTYQINGRSSVGGTVIASFAPEVAQAFAGLPGQFQTIGASAEDGISQEELVERITAALPADSDAEVVTGEVASKEISDAISQGLSFFTTFLMIFAVIALTVGAFIIYNTFSILVAQRSKELALLRAIGSTRRQVLASVLVEAALVGLVAALVGILAGIGLAIGIQALLSSIGVDLPTTGTKIASSTIITALIAGLGVTFFSALVPAWRATRVPPIAALREVATDTSGTSKWRAALGVLAFILALLNLAPAFGKDPDTGALQQVGVGALLVLLSIIILGPVIAQPLSRLLGAPLSAWRGTPGHLARENAARSPKRTASTAAALMIGVALVGFITIFAESARSSIDEELTRGLRADLILQSSSFDVGIPLELSERIQDLDDVAVVSSMRQGIAQVTYPDGEDTIAFLGAINPERYGQLVNVRMESGELTDLRPGGIILDRHVAADHDLAIGDSLSVTFMTGSSVELTVEALGDDATLLGNFILTHEDWEANVPNQTDGMVFVKGASGVSVERLHDEVSELAEGYPTVEVQDRDEFLGSVASQLNAALNIVYGLLAISIIIALIGIANTLSLSIHERTRELGLLRAVGMTRRQLRSSIRWEAAIIALIGTIEGLLIALGLSFTLIKALSGQGFSVYDVPVTQLVVIVVAFGALGVLASLRPASRAAKLNVLEAISTD